MQLHLNILTTNIPAILACIFNEIALTLSFIINQNYVWNWLEDENIMRNSQKFSLSRKTIVGQSAAISSKHLINTFSTNKLLFNSEIRKFSENRFYEVDKMNKRVHHANKNAKMEHKYNNTSIECLLLMLLLLQLLYLMLCFFICSKCAHLCSAFKTNSTKIFQWIWCHQIHNLQEIRLKKKHTENACVE